MPISPEGLPAPFKAHHLNQDRTGRDLSGLHQGFLFEDAVSDARRLELQKHVQTCSVLLVREKFQHDRRKHRV